MARDEKKDDHRGAGALFIPAGIFLGFGWGFLIDNVAAGFFLGMGLGFVAFAITTIIMGSCCRKK